MNSFFKPGITPFHILPLLLLASFNFLCVNQTFTQAKKPTIMVIPSDVWYNSNQFMTEFDNQGSKIKVPDYKRAFQENADLLLVISTINELMAERGFPLKNMETVLKNLEEEAAEESMLSSSTSGSSIAETPFDKLKKTAKADIIMQMTWTVHTQGPKKSITFSLQGIDAYTGKQIAGASGTGDPSFTVELPVLLREAVVSHIDNFNSQLQTHFEDLFTNGREITLRMKKWSSSEHSFESEFEGEELGALIENWLTENTVGGRFSTSDATENQMLFEQVRIPLFDEKGKAIDARSWTRGLQKMLKEKYVIESKLLLKGLGQAQLIIGEK